MINLEPLDGQELVFLYYLLVFFFGLYIKNGGLVMEKIQLMQNLINDMKALTNTLEKITQLENTREANYEKNNNKEEKLITLEEVRAVLAQKSKEGFTDKVRDLINYYGCHKLSEIDSKYYAEILQKVEKF